MIHTRNLNIYIKNNNVCSYEYVILVEINAIVYNAKENKKDIEYYQEVK